MKKRDSSPVYYGEPRKAYWPLVYTVHHPKGYGGNPPDFVVYKAPGDGGLEVRKNVFPGIDSVEGKILLQQLIKDMDSLRCRSSVEFLALYHKDLINGETEQGLSDVEKMARAGLLHEKWADDWNSDDDYYYNSD